MLHVEQIADPQPRKRLGRPPVHLVPPTEFGRWLAEHDMTSSAFVVLARAQANEVGVDPALVPIAKSITAIASARRAPSAPVMLVIRHVTGGAIDLEHWVRDLFHDRRPIVT